MTTTQTQIENYPYPFRISCPECGDIMEWEKERSCRNGHAVQDISSIPLCFTPDGLQRKNTADPWYHIQDALRVAAMVDAAPTFPGSIDRFFEHRSAELQSDLSHEKHLITRRTVPICNECVAEASLLMTKMKKLFPPPERFHIDIGCGLGYGLAASAKSYFGSNVIGLDLSPHYLVMARKLLREEGVEGVRLACADICDGWPIPLQEYDVGFISMEGVLEHIKDVPAFFANIRRVRSFPLAIYLTVPYRWTVNLESHFNLRFVSWLPERFQDRYIARKLGVEKIDHVEFYSKRSLRKTLRRYFADKAIAIELNSDNWREAHYLKCLIYIEGPESFT